MCIFSRRKTRKSRDPIIRVYIYIHIVLIIVIMIVIIITTTIVIVVQYICVCVCVRFRNYNYYYYYYYYTIYTCFFEITIYLLFYNIHIYIYIQYISTYFLQRVFSVIHTFSQTDSRWMDAFESRRANRLLAVPGDPSRKRCSPFEAPGTNNNKGAKKSAGRSHDPMGNLEKSKGRSHENWEIPWKIWK